MVLMKNAIVEITAWNQINRNLNMKINQGHAIWANGIKHALSNYDFDSLILMDADEDRLDEIIDLINKAKELKMFRSS